MNEELFSIFTDIQIQAIKDCIQFGLSGDLSCTFHGDEEVTDTYGYCTGNIYKGGHFSNQQISGICSGIAKVIKKSKPNWMHYDPFYWGDNSGGVMFFHYERMGTTMDELIEWSITKKS